MNLFETIKAAVPVRQAAEHYGLKVNRNDMACCSFHNDRHPSLKLNEDYFFCFGCGATGDVIDFVARLFDLSSYEAAQKLAVDFGLDPKPPTAVALPRPKHPYIRQFREDEMVDNSGNHELVEELADQIDDLRGDRQDILAEVAERTDLQARMNDMIAFLEEMPAAVTEYSEALARRLVERITIFDEKIVVELKSGLQMEVEE